MTVAAGTRLLVLHDVGDPSAGADWRLAAAAGWPGPADAPDLPGHGGEPVPLGGCYDAADAVLLALRRALVPADRDAPVVVGTRANGWAAWLLALGGRAAGLVLVDGLGGPWRDARGRIAAGRDWLRAIAADPDAVAPARAGGLDPRLRHGLPPHRSRALVERAAAVTTVPTLLVETPASPLDPADVDAVVTHFAAPVAVARPPGASPSAVLQAVTAWWPDAS